MKSSITKLLVAFVAIIAASSALANQQYSSVIAFGDSLSDNGNYYRLVNKLTPLAPQNGSPPLPYFYGRYYNGPVAVELLAENLGVTLQDFAVGGATSGLTNEDPRFPRTGVLGQVQDYVATNERLNDDALYVVWGGANDFLGAANLGTPGVAQAVIANAISNLTQSIGILYAHGARHFLIPNLPDLGLIPLNRGAQAAQATFLSATFNQLYAGALQTLGQQLRHSDIRTVDVAALLDKVAANQTYYQFQNVTDECVSDPTYFCILNSFNAGPAAGYLFWDSVHPTASAHALLAGQFAAAVAQPGSNKPPEHPHDRDWLSRVREKH
jgi:phospholipase/lecithinase/hemolysin